MGECYSTQHIEQQSTLRNNRPQKCYILDGPPSLIIQLTNGTIQTISIKKQLSTIELTMRIQPGIYFNTNNQLHIFIQVQQINDRKLLQAAHAYYQAQNNISQYNQLIKPQSAYLIHKDNKYIFMIQSISLGDKNNKFVDLVQLGKRMRQKGICWQDLEFSDILVQVMRKYGKIGDKQCGISNVIVGTDGSVHLLGLFQATSPAINNQQLQSILLQALFGRKQNKISSYLTLQQSCQFKHPTSLSILQNLPNKITLQKQNKYNNITNPSLKFIKDYIAAYHYKLQQYHEQFVQRLMLLGQYQKAQELLETYMVKTNGYNTINEENFRKFVYLFKIKEVLKPKSLELTQAKTRVYTATKFLANKFKAENNYTKAQKYYYLMTFYSVGKPEEEIYVSLAEVSRALNKNIDAQSVLNQGLLQYENSRLLYMWLIIYACDCVKIAQAQQFLFKATPFFRTLEMQICSAKIWLGKAIINPPKRGEYIQKAEQNLTKSVIQSYIKQPESASIPTTLALYYETLGDCYFQSYNFPKAQQYYHTSQILLKNDKGTSYRLANIIAAEANCLMMSKKYQEAVTAYNQAQQFLKNSQCKNLRDSIRGNRGIVKIRMGYKQQGHKQIQTVLQDTDKETLKTDYNYIFLKNVLQRSKAQEF